ncbi:pectinesterase inhibitor-like [Aristolochia californica]|uniref:pectinesterase inhibitor-like n=1 Tax=Aristolochia californica TaxID=171875 RepID=UPI0035DA78BD
MASLAACPALLPLLFLFFLPCLPARVTLQTSNLIDHVCRLHDDYNFCVVALASDPSSGSADLTNLGFISFELVLANITDTSLYIEEQLAIEKDAKTKKSLTDCLQGYREAAEDTRAGKQALTAKDYQRMSIEALAVGTAAGGCERAFGGPPGRTPLSPRDRNLDLLSEIPWLIAAMLH